MFRIGRKFKRKFPVTMNIYYKYQDKYESENDLNIRKIARANAQWKKDLIPVSVLNIVLCLAYFTNYVKLWDLAGYEILKLMGVLFITLLICMVTNVARKASILISVLDDLEKKNR